MKNKIPSVRDIIDTIKNIFESYVQRGKVNIDFDLSDDEKNMKWYIRFMKQRPYFISKHGPYRLYRLGIDNGYVFLVGKNSIEFFVEYETEHFKLFNKKVVTGIRLRKRKSSDPHVIPIAKYVFVNYMLEKFECVMCDRSLTTEGENFWNRRMIELSNNASQYTIGVMNADKTAYMYDPKIETFSKWFEKQDVNSTEDWLYSEKRFFIFKGVL